MGSDPVPTGENNGVWSLKTRNKFQTLCKHANIRNMNRLLKPEVEIPRNLMVTATRLKRRGRLANRYSV